MQESKTFINDMTEGPVFSKLARFAVPIMLANLLQAVYSMVDMIVVGQFCGSAGLSAVGIGGQLLTLALAFGMGFSSGAQTVISQQVGMKSQKIAKTIGTLLTTELIMAIVVGAVGIGLHTQILNMMNTPESAFADAVLYLVICCCGMIFIYGYNAVCAILRGMGESRLPMVFIGIASIVNVVLDLIFVALCGWGAAGAAAATVFAQALSFLFALIYLIRHREAVGFDFRLRSFAIDREQLGVLCKLGIPFVAQQFLITGSITFVNAQINAYGVVASAVDSVGGKLNTVVNIVTGAISTASATMISQCFGARKMDRVKQTVRACGLICMLWYLLLGSCYLFLPRQIFGLFTSEAAVLDMAPTYLRIALIWLMALCSMCCFFSLVSGIGYASFNLIVGLLDGVVARIGLSVLLGYVFSIYSSGLYGYWLGNSLAGFVTTISMGIYYLTGRWQKREAVTR